MFYFESQTTSLSVLSETINFGHVLHRSCANIPSVLLGCDPRDTRGSLAGAPPQAPLYGGPMLFSHQAPLDL